MRITVARLRQAIVVLACLLVTVLIGFLGYARYRFHQLEKDLPARLGVNIQQTADGYTYSQSSKGHTLFTIHASRLIQYRSGGNAVLHDVSIMLYGPAGSNRVDTISGSDFDYDPKDQIVQAQGKVSIDLQGFGSGNTSQQDRIHVTTSGLVFNQKTGQADTSQHTEFAFPRASGSSTGAHYNSKTGVLVLDSQVDITTATKAESSPAVIRAAHAQVERNSHQAFLLDPRTNYKSEQGSADSAIVQFRQDGSAQSIHAHGNVHMITADGAVMTAADSVTQMDDDSHLKTTDLSGGVNFASKSPDESMHGAAVSGTLTFGRDSMLRHAQFRDNVSIVDQVFKLARDPNGTASRKIQAEKLDVDFVPGPHGKTAVAQKALATGNAVVHLRTTPSKGPQQLATISGDQLLALLTADGRAIRQLNGTGHTSIIDHAGDGSTNTSTGDRLQVTFNAQPTSGPRPKSGKSPSTTAQASQIETAIQDGHVILTQKPAQKPGASAPAPLIAWAQHAEYHAASQVLQLTGNPRLDDGQSTQLTAAVIDYHRDTGDAAAIGGVKATWAQGTATAIRTQPASDPSTLSLGGEGPVHITADHAFLARSTGTSTFYGEASTDARMWQGANSIMAPVLELTRSPQMLKAHGAPGSSGAVVDANFTSAIGAKRQLSTVRVRSRTLSYSEADRRGDFRGNVTAQDPDGVIHADQAQIYLAPAAKSGKAHPAGRQTQLQRIVATGHIVITQPGRKGVGERLVYTSDDGRYVLTGSPGHPPYLEDAAKGTTTGATLIFNSQNDSVVVSGGPSGAVTETRAPK